MYQIICLGLVALQLTACTVVHPVVSHMLVPIDKQDREDLKNGNLLAVRDRYEDRGINSLRDEELELLCDIYVKHMSIDDAVDCLDRLKTRTIDNTILQRITGKRALIAYLLGHYQRASYLSKDLQGDGGKYVHALAQAKLGDTQTALDIAERWRLALNPQQVYLSANLYLVLGRYHDVLKVLNSPEAGLARDHGLTARRNIFGQLIKPVPLKIDLFEEFGFGLLNTYSYAPTVNVYVEYLLAKAYLETGDLQSARSRLDTVIAYPYIHVYREVLWRALHERARIAEMDGSPQKAINLDKRAIKLIEDVRAAISTEAGRIGFVGNKQSVYKDIIRLLLAQGDVASAFEYSERSRSRALVDVLATQQKFGVSEKLKVKMDALIRDYQRTENRILEIQGNDAAKDIRTLTRSHNSKRQKLLSLQPVLSGLLTMDIAKDKLQPISKSLNADETMLSYFKAKNSWYVFVIKQGSIGAYRLDLHDVAQEIRDFRFALTNGARTQYMAQGRILYDRLIRPVQNQLSESLTIVPYGPLHYLPFAALYSDHAFLIQKHKLRILPSAEVATIISSLKKPMGSLLAIGNPIRNDAAPLPYAEKEARQIARIYRPSDLLTGKKATFLRFHQLARSHDIVHIAAHGEFNKADPLQSRLLLTPTDNDTGDLTASRLYGLVPQLNTSIVVLSACETALADITTGDEMIGLYRGFLYAGAKSIIGSLWRISDQTTVNLMEQFYEGLRRHMSRADAFHEAQIKTLEQYPNTATWAAFVYTGGL